MTDRTLKAAATRAGLSPAEYTDRLDRGLLYCYRDQDWHPAEAFAVDGSRVSGRAASCTASVRRAREARRDAAELGGAARLLTAPERRIVDAMQALARRWPPSIMLVSMDGDLQIVDAAEYHAGNDYRLNGAERQAASVLANIDGIPNDGGGW